MNAQRDALTVQSAEGPAGSETRHVKLEKEEPLIEQVGLSEIVCAPGSLVPCQFPCYDSGSMSICYICGPLPD